MRKTKTHGRHVRSSVQLKRTEKQKQAFLKAFAKCGNVFRACEKSKVGRQTHYDWLHDPGYRHAFEDLKQQWIEVLEAEADRRGKDGVKKPVYYRGEVCGHVIEYSDTLLIVRLKALDPVHYRENFHIAGKVEHTIDEAAREALMEDPKARALTRELTGLLVDHLKAHAANGNGGHSPKTDPRSSVRQ